MPYPPPGALQSSADANRVPANVVLFHIQKLLARDAALLISREVGIRACAAEGKAPFAAQCFLANKPTDPCGRLISNLKDNGANGSSSPSDRRWAKQAADDYAPISLARPADICASLSACKDQYGTAEMEVDDITHAHNRTCVTKESAHIGTLAISIRGREYWAIPLVNQFGQYQSAFPCEVVAQEIVRQTT